MPKFSRVPSLKFPAFDLAFYISILMVRISEIKQSSDFLETFLGKFLVINPPYLYF